MKSILIQVEHLREGDLIDLTPILVERGPEVFEYAEDDYESALDLAEFEYATVEEVIVDHDGYIVIYNNQCSLAFERGTLIELIGDDIRGPIESGN